MHENHVAHRYVRTLKIILVLDLTMTVTVHVKTSCLTHLVCTQILSIRRIQAKARIFVKRRKGIHALDAPRDTFLSVTLDLEKDGSSRSR